MSNQTGPTDHETKPNTDEAVEFLKSRDARGPRHLCAIVPDGKLVAKTFDSPEIDKLSEFIVRHQARSNLYVHVNPLVRTVRARKAKKADVAVVEWLHIDIDDTDGLEQLRAFALPPTATVFSGGGYNAYWKLAPPL